METLVCHNTDCGNFRSKITRNMRNHCMALRDRTVLDPEHCPCFIDKEKDRLIRVRYDNRIDATARADAAERLVELYG